MSLNLHNGEFTNEDFHGGMGWAGEPPRNPLYSRSTPDALIAALCQDEYERYASLDCAGYRSAFLETQGPNDEEREEVEEDERLAA